MSVAVKTLVSYNVPFAIKGGGHMAVSGSSKKFSIPFPVLFSM